MKLVRMIVGGALAGGVAVFGATHPFDDETRRDESGQITTAGGLGAFVVQVGDCIQMPDEELVVSVEGVPCDTPHDAEAYAKFDVSGPTDYDPESVESRALEGCIERWQGAIGTVYETDIELDIYAMRPTESSWTLGDRAVVCFVASIDGSQLTGSRRNGH